MGQELAECVGSRRKARWDPDALRKLGNHLPQAGVFAADGLNVRHAQALERHDQVGRIEKFRHRMLQKLKPFSDPPTKTLTDRATCHFPVIAVLGNVTGT